MSDLRKGDKVKLKDYHLIKADSRAFYSKLAYPDKVYEIEFITYMNEVYVAGENNYFHGSSLERV